MYWKPVAISIQLGTTKQSNALSAPRKRHFTNAHNTCYEEFIFTWFNVKMLDREKVMKVVLVLW